MNYLPLLLAASVLMTGCSDKSPAPPEASEENCTPEMMEKILPSLGRAEQQSFEEACGVWSRDRHQRNWTFTPSAPDSY